MGLLAGGGARPEAGHVALAGWPGGAADVSGAGQRDFLGFGLRLYFGMPTYL